MLITTNSWLLEPGGSMSHSQEPSKNPYPEPNQPNSPYLRESNAHLFQPNIVFKIGVRIRFDGALDSSANFSSLMRPNISLVILFSNTLNQHRCKNMIFKIIDN